MASAAELAIVRLLVAFLFLAACLPLLPVGAWVVRLFDFPRVQLAVAAAGSALWLGWRVSRLSEPIESVILLVLAIGVFLWQLSRILAYTPVWTPEVRAVEVATDGRLTICVANVQYDNPSHTKTVEQLLQRDDDLLLLIEIDEAWEAALEPLAKRYPYQAGRVLPEGHGIRLYSKLEVESVEVRYLVSEQRPSVFAVLRDGAGQRIDFVGLHPTPPGLYDKDQGNRYDSRIRDAELLLVAKEIEQRRSANWLVAGDFNDVAWSHTTRLFKRLSGLRDPRVGRGLYNTYHADWWALRFPIDHVFVSSTAEIHHLDRFRPEGSDHFAIVTELQFASKADPKPSPVGNDRTDAEEIIEEGRDEAADRGEAAE
ncbi:MAG: endonuclease/exonuclease/phosphatase family protein [Planctomycetota bacterium]